MRYNGKIMNTLVIKNKLSGALPALISGKSLALVACLALVYYPPTRDLMFKSLADAYYQVSVFVAATLIGLLLFERSRRSELAELLQRHQRKQVLLAAMFGAIPGCGGAIFIVMQYVRGSVSFGGVVATLTATMGDAAFLLLARAPLTALIVFVTCLIVGILFGYAVDAVHGRDFLRFRGEVPAAETIRESSWLSPMYWLWFILFLPGAVIGIGYAMQYKMGEVLAITRWGNFDWVLPFGAAAAMLAICMWVLNPVSDIRLCMSTQRSITRRAADTTNFITFWVLCGFVGYALLEEFFHLDLANFFGAWAGWTPLIAVLIGFVPGCGPQVVVTTLYLNGVIPLSAQLANAISNDGDALFPAMALAPKASIIATLYTAMPALVIGYAWFFLYE